MFIFVLEKNGKIADLPFSSFFFFFLVKGLKSWSTGDFSEELCRAVLMAMVWYNQFYLKTSPLGCRVTSLIAFPKDKSDTRP